MGKNYHLAAGDAHTRKVFASLFQKAVGVGGGKAPSSPVATGETPKKYKVKIADKTIRAHARAAARRGQPPYADRRGTRKQ